MPREKGLLDLEWLAAARGMSQGRMAKALGVRQQQLSKWEAGVLAPMSVAPALAKALGVTEDAVLLKCGYTPRWLQEMLTERPETLEQIKNMRGRR